jgi:hypothetical protein
MSEMPLTESNSRERFESDTAEHALTVLRDDGLYRHLRCQKPGTYIYGFDVVTWPGYLAIVGDAGDYLFSRIRDMFKFFESDGERINPQYWAEKLQGPGQDMARSFSERAYRQHVREWLDEVSEDIFESERVEELVVAVERDLLGGQAYHENEAHRLLNEFEHDGIRIRDAWEWSLRDFDYRFLWCCHAIVWAIRKYREHQRAPIGAARG